ncbi:hypothetical protein T459_29146 [Capsicum annuum]|uniref:Uncharacterized protein n=2 Tax=Capsicum annuum TaxID=4072 RepID=A0A2G2Y580_CAPAN|nr:hypothetical protein T459_29146 [Capsicum annuum]
MVMDVNKEMNAAFVKAEKEMDEVDEMLVGRRFTKANSKRGSGINQVLKSAVDTVVKKESMSSVDTVVKKEDEKCDSQNKPSNFSSVLMDDKISQSAGIVEGQLCRTQMDFDHSRELRGKRKVSSPISDLLHVKAEPVDNNMVETAVKNEPDSLPHSSMVQVKSNHGITYELSEDELDDMVLSERKKLYSTRWDPSYNFGRVVECSIQIVSSVSDCIPTSSAHAKPLKVYPPRKRRKTVTDSVQTAMEEDAPGLLKVLLAKGVNVDEIKLYGESERDEPLDDLSTEDSFSELQAVISKLFSSQRQSLLKLAPLQCTRAEKVSYCLACLFSLIEQARYLQSRKWPVEWGWCRDLQSFIFVFERHNRIVLERPEYGYATYFFELVDSSPIDWQIRRLVIAMKLTSCSRATLIENRTLTVGKDLSEGEAKVLKSYGWVPNTALGTMLKYYDRVYHDRVSEKQSVEWKSKIGKLLIAGITGGIIVEKDEENVAQSCPEIKLELE